MQVFGRLVGGGSICACGAGPLGAQKLAQRGPKVWAKCEQRGAPKAEGSARMSTTSGELGPPFWPVEAKRARECVRRVSERERESVSGCLAC